MEANLNPNSNSIVCARAKKANCSCSIDVIDELGLLSTEGMKLAIDNWLLENSIKRSCNS